MHARELVELAAILSAQGPMLIRSSPQLSSHGVQQYWTASKCRLDRWARNLKSFAADAAQLDTAAVRMQWPLVRGVLEEILTGEVLTRVWTAVLCLYDRQHGGNEFESLARSIMIGHLEARHRVLMLLVRGPGIDAEGAVKLNHLRRRASAGPICWSGTSPAMATWPKWPSTPIGRSSSRGTWNFNRTRKAGGKPGRCCKLPCGQPSNADWRR